MKGLTWGGGGDTGRGIESSYPRVEQKRKDRRGCDVLGGDRVLDLACLVNGFANLVRWDGGDD